MKKKIIFIFFILVAITLNCQAVEWKQPNIGEHPFKVNSNLIIPITDDVSKLTDNEKREYLRKIYDNKYITLVQNGYIFEVRDDNEKNYLYYDKDLNIFATIKNGKIDIISAYNSKGGRFVGICDADIQKCGMYDAKKNLFTGLEYDNIPNDTFSGTPVLVKNGKKIYLQPFKHVGLSSLIVTSWIISIPFVIILIPFFFMII